jgi:energy-coupling factor transporter transmembrane protein EcfT
MSAILLEHKNLTRSRIHPVAWWVWAITLSIALFISSQPWFAAGLVFACAILVRSFKESHPWSRSFAVAMRLIAVIIAIRMIIAILIGVPIPGTTIITLPTVQLPEWIAGIRLGGAVTTERLTSTLGEVMIIVGVVALFAAATSLTSPHRLIRAIPLAFYQLGLILTIATSVFPQLVVSIQRIRLARRLRGQKVRGLRHWRKIAIPLLEDALERSLDLAAAMESRGFGQRVRRSSYRPDRWGVFENAILLSSLLITGAIWFAPIDGALSYFIIGLFAALLALFRKERA